MPQTEGPIRNNRTKAKASEGDPSKSIARRQDSLSAKERVEALKAIEAIADELLRALMLSLLGPQLAARERKRAFAAIGRITDVNARIVGLSSFIGYASPKERRDILASVSGIGDDCERSVALAALAPHLTQVEILQSVDAARKIQDRWTRIGALVSLAQHATGERFTQIIHEAFEDAGTLIDSFEEASALEMLAPNLSKEQLDRALRRIEMFGGPVYQFELALRSMAPFLSERQLDQAVDLARRSEQARIRLSHLIILLPYLTGEKKETVAKEALRLALADGFFAVGDVETVASHLQSELGYEGIDLAEQIEDPWRRAEALVLVMPYLNLSLRSLALAKSLEIVEFDFQRVQLLTAASTYMPEEEARPIVRRAIDLAKTIDVDSLRASMFAGMLNLLPDHEINEACDAALEAAAADGQDRVLYEVIKSTTPYLSIEQKEAAIRLSHRIDDDQKRDEVASLLSGTQGERYRREILSTPKVSEKLSESPLRKKQYERAFDVASKIADENLLALALTALIPRLVSDHRDKALEIIRGIRSVSLRLLALRKVSSYYSTEEWPLVTETALEIGRELASANVVGLIGYDRKNSAIGRLGADLRREGPEKSTQNQEIEAQNKVVELIREELKWYRENLATADISKKNKDHSKTTPRPKRFGDILPETPPRLWTPHGRGRPKPGAGAERLLLFIREVYGPFFAKHRERLRAYIFSKDPTLWRAIVNFESRGGKLPEDIKMPSERTNANERLQRAAKELLGATGTSPTAVRAGMLTKRERASVRKKLWRSKRLGQS